MKAPTNLISPSAVPTKLKLASTRDAKCTHREQSQSITLPPALFWGTFCQALGKAIYHHIHSGRFPAGFPYLSSSTLTRHFRRFISCRMQEKWVSNNIYVYKDKEQAILWRIRSSCVHERWQLS